MRGVLLAVCVGVLAMAAATGNAQPAPVSIHDDALDTVASFTTERALPKDLYRIPDFEQAFLRAYVDKKTGAERFQLYAFIWYRGDWRNYNRINYETLVGPAAGQLVTIAHDVHDCTRYDCYLSEDVAFDLDPALLRAWIATTDTAHSGWNFKLGAQRGEDLHEGILRSELGAIVGAVDSYKAAHGLR